MASIPPFGLRMQPELKERIEAVARANSRSLNSEIIHRLERTLVEDDRQANSDGLDAMVASADDEPIQREFQEAIAKAVRSVMERNNLTGTGRGKKASK